jgi:hypothetical protein
MNKLKLLIIIRYFPSLGAFTSYPFRHRQMTSSPPGGSEEWFFDVLGSYDILCYIAALQLPGRRYHDVLCGDWAALHGHLSLIKSRQDVLEFSSDAMDNAAAHGYLEIVTWLYWNRYEWGNQFAMDHAAGNGHLHVVKWIHEHTDDGCTKRGLASAIHNGHLEVAEYIKKYRCLRYVDRKDWAE